MNKKSKAKINSADVSEKYSQMKTKYDLLGINLSQALELFLREKDIKVLSVNHRVKEKSSFLEKIDRKNYESPFDEIEDFCGIRIICYYQSDVDKISEILSKEFEILENQDKENLLQADQFGYRSTHFIVKIKKDWLQAPNYRGLEDLKAEIQIRTVLMHAWAEIEHKLAYKKSSHVPKQFKRKLSRISAKLEEADEQFEELRNEITNYKEDVVETVKNDSNNTEKIELNLDSLQAFLDAEFPDRGKDILDTMDLVDEFLKFNISLQELKIAYENVREYLPKIEQEEFKGNSQGKGWVQVGVARKIMDIANENYLANRHPNERHKQMPRKWREIIQNEEIKKNKEKQPM